MKKIIFIITLFNLTISFGQNFDEIKNYEFKTIESYQTEKPKVLLFANYLFDNPASKEELNRLYAIQYIMKWMTGTPDYKFELGKREIDLTKGNSDLLGLYMAAITKVVLENKGDKLDSDSIYNRAEALLVNYCSDATNKMKPSRKIKKILKSRKA